MTLESNNKYSLHVYQQTMLLDFQEDLKRLRSIIECLEKEIQQFSKYEPMPYRVATIDEIKNLCHLSNVFKKSIVDQIRKDLDRMEDSDRKYSYIKI